MTKEPPLRALKRTLLNGLFIVAPLGLTVIMLAWLVSLIDGLLSPLALFAGRPIPGLGLLVAVLLVFVAGLLGSNLVGRHLLELSEELLLRIPVFNWVYRTIKQLSEVFSPEGKDSFKSVVLVEYPRPEVFSLGFVTKRVSLERDGKKKELVCVYVPTNHMYIGDFILVPADKVIATTMTQQEAVQAAISAGAALPDVLKAEAPKN
jgi:uncharacterized membrane protein